MNETRITLQNGEQSQLFYNPETESRIATLIERYLHQNVRIRVFYGDTDRTDFERVHGHKPDPGKDWGEENDVTGYIGCSTGPIKIPLLVHNKRSYGGGGILTSCIVRMLVNGCEVYRHPNYHSEYDNAEVVPSELAPEYSHAVVTNGGEVARFHSEKSAQNYLAFMRGERMSK